MATSTLVVSPTRRAYVSERFFAAMNDIEVATVERCRIESAMWRPDHGKEWSISRDGFAVVGIESLLAGSSPLVR
jgi:hypothetical protein